MDTTEKNNLKSINTSADLPLSAPADQFKEKFEQALTKVVRVQSTLYNCITITQANPSDWSGPPSPLMDRSAFFSYLKTKDGISILFVINNGKIVSSIRVN